MNEEQNVVDEKKVDLMLLSNWFGAGRLYRENMLAILIADFY
jgi:hypothetical protein